MREVHRDEKLWYDVRRRGRKKRAEKKAGDSFCLRAQSVYDCVARCNFHVFSVCWSARRGAAATDPPGRQERQHRDPPDENDDCDGR